VWYIGKYTEYSIRIVPKKCSLYAVSIRPWSPLEPLKCTSTASTSRLSLLPTGAHPHRKPRSLHSNNTRCVPNHHPQRTTPTLSVTRGMTVPTLFTLLSHAHPTLWPPSIPLNIPHYNGLFTRCWFIPTAFAILIPSLTALIQK